MCFATPFGPTTKVVHFGGPCRAAFIKQHQQIARAGAGGSNQSLGLGQARAEDFVDLLDVEDVLDLRIKLAGGRILTLRFVNGVATFESLTRDGSASAPATFAVALQIARKAVVGHTAGVTIDGADVALAAPDVMAPATKAAIPPRSIT